MLSSLKSTNFQVFIKCLNFDGDEVFRKIGQIALDEEEIGFCLRTEDFKEPIENSLKVEAIFPYARKSARSFSIIKIVIQDTIMRRAPVLNKLEVWGVPSFRGSLEEIEEINKLLNDLKVLQDVPDNIREESPEADESFKIPEDFLDAITHELLVMPYILPSGSVIDESTMEKHNKHEQSYGRLPSDPFTGLIYTSENQPKFNESLKARLDEFKLHNSSEIDVRNSGRTVGRKNKLVPSTSGLISNGHISKKIKFYGSSSADLDTIISSIYKNNQISIFTKPKEPSEGDDNQRACNKCKTTSSGFYQINPCSHLFCKPCLLKLNSTCETCNTSFLSKDVVKINV